MHFHLMSLVLFTDLDMNTLFIGKKNNSWARNKKMHSKVPYVIISYYKSTNTH